METEGIGHDGRFYIERFRQSHHNIAQTNTRPFWQTQWTLGVALRFAVSIDRGPRPGGKRRPRRFTGDGLPHDGCQGGQSPPRTTTGQAGSYIGQAWELDGRWDAHDNISFQVGWHVLMKGNFAIYAPDAPTDRSNVNYWFVQTEIRF